MRQFKSRGFGKWRTHEKSGAFWTPDFIDYAGFSTLDSIVRAKKVFGLSGFCVITQRDHALRAIYIARANGIDVVGFPAKDVSTLRGLRTRFRESLARVRTLFDVHVLGRKPHLLGPTVVIGQA